MCEQGQVPYYFWDDLKFIIVLQNIHNSLLYFNILAFVISLSIFNNFLFELQLAVSISHNIDRIYTRIA